MKNRLSPLIVTVLLVATSLTAQVCGTYEGSFEEEVQKYPAFYKGLEDLEIELEANYRSALSKMKHLKVVEGKRIIPVVVHVIHSFGSENISDAAIQAALDALNKNINGQSDKFLNQSGGNFLTPDIFASVRGVANVEFRLAKLDPQGNPTNGIVRVVSELTNGPENRNEVKALSYWNSYQYFNIWTVKSFFEGGLLGFAQFPFSGLMSTDGVALLASNMSQSDNTTLTHEAGHWLGLRHIWGDAECGDDDIKDTPIQKYDNNGSSESSPTPPGYPRGSPSTFPYHVGLPNGCVADSLNPAGEMFMNYMSYTTDPYMTMFTAGQVEVMNETLEGEYDAETDTTDIGYREYMWSAVNIAATGVADGYLIPECEQEADFKSTTGYSLCLGETILFKNNQNQFSTTGTINSITYDFGDGNTDASGASTIPYSYNTLGNYNVSLTIEYNETTEARADNLSDLVGYDSYDENIEILNVQGTEAELIAMNATNINLHLDIDSLSIESKWKYNAPEDSVVGAHSSFPLGLDTFQLIFSAEQGDSLELEEYARLALCFATWEKDSTDWEGTVITFYYGSYESQSFDAYFMDTLFYRGQLKDTTYVAYYNNSCSSTTVKENLVVVNATSSSNTAGSYIYSFEDASELSDDWHVTKGTPAGEWSFNSIENSSWEWVDGVAVSGSAGLMIDRDNLVSGTTDELVSVAYDLSALTSPSISFSWSGAAVNTFPDNKLNIYYSDDCGETWPNSNKILTLSALDVANAGLYSINFKPEENQWRDTVITKAVLKKDNIIFK